MKAVKLVQTLEARDFEDPWGFGKTLTIRRFGHPEFQQQRENAYDEVALEVFSAGFLKTALGDSKGMDDAAILERLEARMHDAIAKRYREQQERDPLETVEKERRIIALLVKDWQGFKGSATPKSVLAELLDPKDTHWLPRFTDPEGNQAKDPRIPKGAKIRECDTEKTYKPGHFKPGELVRLDGGDLFPVLDSGEISEDPLSMDLPEGWSEWEFGGQPMSAAWAEFILDRAHKVQEEYDAGLGAVEKN